MPAASHTAGTSYSKRVVSSKYPADDGWTAKLVAVSGVNRIEIAGAADGADHLFEVEPVTTRYWAPGEYQLHVFAEKGGAKHVAYGPSELRIWPDPEAQALEVSKLQAELDAVDAAISGVLGGEGVQSYTFETSTGRRSADRMNLADLRTHRAWVADRLEAERARQQGRPSRRGWRRISTKFSR